LMSGTRTDGQNTVPSSGASTSGSPSSIAEVLPAPRGGERSSSASAASVGLARPHRRQRHNAGGHQNQQQQHRYHFNNLEAAMPVNIWGLDRRDVWRTCFCFHVRTVTIFIGVCHLVRKERFIITDSFNSLFNLLLICKFFTDAVHFVPIIFGCNVYV
jgi:hypothetical protein